MGGTVAVLVITDTSGPSCVWQVEVAYLMFAEQRNAYLHPAQYVPPAWATILSRLISCIMTLDKLLTGYLLQFSYL